jgi:ABC-2 type transport system ATP-binding protein
MIQANNLWKRFGRHEALRGLNFTVPAGSAYALIGANGAGKTTQGGHEHYRADTR